MPVFGFLCFFLTSIFCFQFVCRYVLPRNSPSGCTCELRIDIFCFLSLLGRRMLQWLDEDCVFLDVTCSSNKLGRYLQQVCKKTLITRKSKLGLQFVLFPVLNVMNTNYLLCTICTRWGKKECTMTAQKHYSEAGPLQQPLSQILMLRFQLLNTRVGVWERERRWGLLLDPSKSVSSVRAYRISVLIRWNRKRNRDSE